MCFSDDGQSIAVGNEDCTVEVWDLARKKRIGPWKAHRETISRVLFMPGGDGLLTASYDSTIKLWDIKTQMEARCFGRTENAYLSVAVSPDGKRVAGGSGVNNYIRIWSAETGQELSRLDGVATRYLAFLADGNTLVSGTPQEIRLWRAPSWVEIETAEKTVERRTP
jgi:WD40 repeat protein